MHVVARKKKKKKKESEEQIDAPPALGGDARTSLRALLDGVVIEEKAAPVRPSPRPPPAPREKASDRPSDTLRGDDRIAYWDAFSGVKPLAGKAAMPATSQPRPKSAPRPDDRSREDDAARARLAALVAGGVRFDVEHREDDRVFGVRSGASTAIVRELARRDASPEATIDLHGMTAAQAEKEVARFVRRKHREGARRLRIVHGKGLHSEGGAVLGDRVVHTLTNGAAAPVILAFASAAPELGGAGALIVELTRS